MKTCQNSPAQTLGKKYETLVQKELCPFENYVPNQWIKFHNDRGMQFCQPDGFFKFKDHILLVEIKLRHSIQAFYQLRDLYSPLLQKYFDLPVRCVEIVKWFDPLVFWPEKILFAETPPWLTEIESFDEKENSPPAEGGSASCEKKENSLPAPCDENGKAHCDEKKKDLPPKEIQVFLWDL